MTFEPYPGGVGAGGYPYPNGAPQSPLQPVPAPSSVVNAVRLMYIGATISLIGVILNIVTRGSLKTRIRNTYPKLTPAQVTRLAHLDFIFIIVLGLIFVGLWLWMAFMCRAGRNWARTTGTVFFGFLTLFLIITLSGAGGGLGGGLALVPAVILWLVGLSAVILLWRKDASAFFRQEQGYYP
ncbi:MAG TPA: hypothetical protein VMU95_26085 [Trebonia sp.]|nr:hypothetical protein [Trebonia sp.]